MRNFKKILILCSLALVLTVIFADASFAQTATGGGNNGLMNVAAGKAVRIFVNYATGATMGKDSTAGAVKDTFGDNDEGIVR